MFPACAIAFWAVVGDLDFIDQNNASLLNSLLTYAKKEAPLTALSCCLKASGDDPRENDALMTEVSSREFPAVDSRQELLQKTLSFMKNRLRPDRISSPQQ